MFRAALQSTLDLTEKPLLSRLSGIPPSMAYPLAGMHWKERWHRAGCEGERLPGAHLARYFSINYQARYFSIIYPSFSPRCLSSGSSLRS